MLLSQKEMEYINKGNSHPEPHETGIKTILRYFPGTHHKIFCRPAINSNIFIFCCGTGENCKREERFLVSWRIMYSAMECYIF